MNRFAAVRLVAARELVERARQPSYLASTAVSCLILVAFAVVPRFFDDGPATYEVGLVGERSAALAPALDPPPGSDATITSRVLADRAEAEAAVAAGHLDAAVVDGATVVVDEDLPATLAGALEGAARTARVRDALAEAGVADAEAAAAVAEAAPLEVAALEPPDAEREERSRLVNIGVFLLFGQIFGYGFWVASGVVEEKASRVVEVILAKVRPSELLAGKVLGLGALGLAQLVVLVAVGLGAAVAAGTVDPPPGLARAAVEVAAWFVLGYAFFACAFAVAGALASRQEELQNSASPLSFVLFGSFAAAVAAAGNPEGTVATVASFVPPSAPLVMPLRTAAGAAAGWEVAVAVAVVVAATAALVPVAGRVYSGGALRTRSSVRLADAWRGAR